MNAIVIFITAANQKDAERLAQVLVEERLAACVQIVPQVISIYRWENQIRQDAEVLMLVKTVAENFDALAEAVRANHSYETPEIVAVPASRISNDYFAWLVENTEQ